MSKTILCADDSVTMQKAAEITFRGSDYQYVGAKSADEALELAKSDKPDLILADAVMPGKTGYDLCSAVKGDPSLADVPVVLLCGNSEAYDEGKGNSVGADGHFTKPWDSTKFLDGITDFLANFTPSEQPAAAAAAPAAAAVPAPAAVEPAPTPEPPPPVVAEPEPAPPVVAAPAPPPKPAPPPVAKPAPPPAAKPAPPPVAKPAPRPAPPPAAKPAPPPSRPAPPPVAKPAPPPAAVADAFRAPMIKGTPSRAIPGFASADAPRNATLMGLPSLGMPPGSVAEAVAKVPAAAAAAAQEAGLDPDGPEVQAIMKVSVEVIERIAWEVVPQLAETIIRENLDKLTAQRQ